VLPHDTLALVGPVSSPAVGTLQDPGPGIEPALSAESLARADTQTAAAGTMTAPVSVATSAANEPTTVPPADAPSEYSETIESNWPLVLRIVCDRPQDVLVKCDGEAAFQLARWPAAGDDGPAQPAAGFEPGRAYAHDGRWVVFWGAEDHFSLKLGRVRGVDVFVNGRRRDVSRLRPGQEIILDDHAAAADRR
jgi:hypothetical protein